MYVVSQMLSCVGKNWLAGWLAGWAPLRHDYLCSYHGTFAAADFRSEYRPLFHACWTRFSAPPVGLLVFVIHPSIPLLIDRSFSLLYHQFAIIFPYLSMHLGFNPIQDVILL